MSPTTRPHLDAELAGLVASTEELRAAAEDVRRRRPGTPEAMPAEYVLRQLVAAADPSLTGEDLERVPEVARNARPNGTHAGPAATAPTPARPRPNGHDDAAPDSPPPPRPPPNIPLLGPEPITDLGHAHRFLKTCGEDFRHVAVRDEWLRWDGRRWSPGAEASAVETMAAIARQVTLEAEAASTGKTPSKFVAAAKRQESAPRIRGAVGLAGVHPPVVIDDSTLDSDPRLLNCMNGTVDLDTGELREHDRQDLITRLVPHPYDATAACPRWDKFLREVTQDRGELITFLRRWFGYCLTAETREQVLVLAIGGGCNGKSVMVETMQHVFGADFAAPAPPGLLLVQKGERHPAELWDLRGRRLVVSNEMPKASTFNEERVKWLTGSDTIKARAMHQDFSSFAPTHKLILCANDLPRVRDSSEGFWRRVRVVPFDVSFRGREDRDLGLALHYEATGILAWAIAGCLEWQREGLGEPPTMQAATANYRNAEDVVGRFIEDTEQSGVFTSAEIYGRFKVWAEAQGERVITQTMLGRELATKGWTRQAGRNRGWTSPQVELALSEKSTT